MNLGYCQYTIKRHPIFVNFSFTGAIPMFFYLTVIGLFIADIVAAAFFGQPIVNGLVAFTLDQSLRRVSAFRLSALLLIVSLQSFFWYGRFGVQLIFMAPITIVLLLVWHALRITPILHYFLLITIMLVQICLLEYAILNQFLSPTCIFLRIIATLGVMIVLSLK